MSNWPLINKGRIRSGIMSSNDSLGFNGAFLIWIESERIKVVCSDGEGWKHVSVSYNDKPHKIPTWSLMCAVKDLFFEPTDWVVQFHPAQSEYINCHSGCLHLWQCVDGRDQPTPPAWMVGPKKQVIV